MPFSNKTIHVDGMKYRDALIEAEIREWILLFSALHIVLSHITTLLILFSIIFHHSILKCKHMSSPLILKNNSLLIIIIDFRIAVFSLLLANSLLHC